MPRFTLGIAALVLVVITAAAFALVPRIFQPGSDAQRSQPLSVVSPSPSPLPPIGPTFIPARTCYHGKHFASLADALAAPPEACALTISDPALTQLPPQIGQLTRLTQLNVIGSPLTALPPEIGKLKNLQVLLLRNNRLKNLPPAINRLTSLKLLDLTGNPIPEVERSKVKQALPLVKVLWE